ncbi:MAG: hypothetical protein ACKVPX_00205 [Myxococcaceae bacterium]
MPSDTQNLPEQRVLAVLARMRDRMQAVALNPYELAGIEEKVDYLTRVAAQIASGGREQVDADLLSITLSELEHAAQGKANFPDEARAHAGRILDLLAVARVDGHLPAPVAEEACSQVFAALGALASEPETTTYARLTAIEQATLTQAGRARETQLGTRADIRC